MRRQAVLLALLLVLVAGVGPAGAVTWGGRDTDHHNVGAMLAFSPDGTDVLGGCSGTLISPRVFLTAGHCTAPLQASNLQPWVTFEQNALAATTFLEVEAAFTHPDFDWRRRSNPRDVGVLILAQEVTGIKPADLPEEGFLANLKKEGKLRSGREAAKFTVVGYGVTLNWPPPRIGEAYGRRRWAQSEYLGLQKAWLLMSQNRATGNGGTCFGDSGGPTFWTQPDGSEILLGITSWGDDPCVATGFSYRVDIADTLGFINTVSADLE